MILVWYGGMVFFVGSVPRGDKIFIFIFNGLIIESGQPGGPRRCDLKIRAHHSLSCRTAHPASVRTLQRTGSLQWWTRKRPQPRPCRKRQLSQHRPPVKPTRRKHPPRLGTATSPKRTNESSTTNPSPTLFPGWLRTVDLPALLFCAKEI